MLMVSLRTILMWASARLTRAVSSVVSKVYRSRLVLCSLLMAVLVMAPLGGCGGLATGPCQGAYTPIRFDGSPSAEEILELALGVVVYVVLRVVVPESWSDCHRGGWN